MVSQNNRKVIEMNYLPSLHNYSNTSGNTKKGEKKVCYFREKSMAQS